jgi:CBS domain-containing protein
MDRDGIAVGVMSRSDILELLASAGAKASKTNVGAIMTKSVVSCHVDQPLQEVWTNRNARSFRCAPILDNEGVRPCTRDCARTPRRGVARGPAPPYIPHRTRFAN